MLHMNTQPTVSVLMPIWNTYEEHLREAIESILNQTFKDFEFLILNDSPDNTKLDEIVASYKDSRILYSRNEVNIGITPSRNKLMSMAKGKYLAIFDHDDISMPNRFECQVAYMEAHPEVGVAGGGVQEIPSGYVKQHPTDDRGIRLALMESCVVTHPVSMLRKSVIDEHGIKYEEEFSPSEDYALWIRLIPYTKFYNIPEVLLRYRMHATNTSVTQSEKMSLATRALQAIAKTQNPALYEEYIAGSVNETKVKLFGFIPLLRIRYKGSGVKVFLFNWLLLYSAKTKRTRKP